MPRSPTSTSSRPYPRLHEAIAACVARADRRAIKELDGNTPLQIHLASCRGPDLPGLSPAARSAVASRMSTARGFAYLLDSTGSTSNMASHPAQLQYKAHRHGFCTESRPKTSVRPTIDCWRCAWTLRASSPASGLGAGRKTRETARRCLESMSTSGPLECARCPSTARSCSLCTTCAQGHLLIRAMPLTAIRRPLIRREHDGVPQIPRATLHKPNQRLLHFWSRAVRC